ncbi:uracil-DNA glycosylase family protein [Helicobacter cappadocius]|uniref:Uracil-DNA glycosylase family protein n=1 Tax=Helicobacter cappadocius TaxID=3063998 RepID=A0AA90T4Z2_9HELI|nr:MULTISPECIES: uracil-DNA glycosylase family protein [unclassified Helicobacter]MDO7252840.1 uracil-DNA glycosylase family protein [Helicobacter sp. faydin-H75]MDP2538883.1 uracil-DNA glycosylase family protein [Helicobacter sp. faydin-H76]
MSQIQKILHLRLLYYQKMFGERYIDNINTQPSNVEVSVPMLSLEDTIAHCALCERSKTSKPSFGILPPKAKIVFISGLPLVDAFNHFVENRSSKMLQDIISNVFKLRAPEYGVLSLVKCNENDLNVPTDSDALICRQYLNQQMTLAPIKITILMGDFVLRHLLGVDFNQHKGRIFSEDGRNYLATYSLNQLLKNPSLKKEAMKHFLLAKGIL